MGLFIVIVGIKKIINFTCLVDSFINRWISQQWTSISDDIFAFLISILLSISFHACQTFELLRVWSFHGEESAALKLVREDRARV